MYSHGSFRGSHKIAKQNLSSVFINNGRGTKERYPAICGKSKLWLFGSHRTFFEEPQF